MFKEVNQWYNPKNFVINVLNVGSDPELFKSLVIANSFLLGFLTAISKILDRPSTLVWDSIGTQELYILIIVVFNIIFLQLLPYILFDKDPESTRFRRLYLESIMLSLGSDILIIDNLDRIEYKQLHDFLEVINWLDNSNMKILILADINELVAIYKAGNHYSEYSDEKVKSYFRKYFNSTVDYLNKEDVYAQATIDFCRKNSIRTNKISYLKLVTLFKHLPENFEYRELEEYYDFILDHHELYSIDLIFLLYYDKNFNNISRFARIPRINDALDFDYFEEVISLILNDYSNSKRLSEYLELTKESMYIDSEYNYKDDIEANHCLENTMYIREAVVALHGMNSIDIICKHADEKLPGNVSFLSDDETKLVNILSLINKYVFDSYWVKLVQKENFLVSQESVSDNINYNFNNGEHSKTISKKIILCFLTIPITQYKGNAKFEKVWGQFIYNNDLVYEEKIDYKSFIRTIIFCFKQWCNRTWKGCKYGR